MGKPTGFLERGRELPSRRDPKERVRDYREVEGDVNEHITTQQASRCMDCGTPFCHSGCPLGNNIPEFNDAAYKGNWKLAYEILASTNNFPEFTGRICPAPCEASCVLGINKPAVAIEYIEKSIIEKAFELGYVVPQMPAQRTGKKVAVVGSGPAGLSAAAQLNQAGHLVTVYEKADEIGGLLRYGIPDFKLDKKVVERRVQLLMDEGITFKTNQNVGVQVSAQSLREEFDAVLLTGGSTVPRDLNIPGRNLKGIHFAMEFLTQQNRRVSGKKVEQTEISASGKDVIVLGGGDTGSDCVGTSNRHGAKSIRQFEILAKPPLERTAGMPWPQWPLILRTSTSHEEGCERAWSLVTKEFLGDAEGHLKGIKIVQVEWKSQGPGKPPSMEEVAGTEKIIPCQLVLLALGFLHPQHQGMIQDLQLAVDDRGNVKCKEYQSSEEGIFAAGDMRRGQSLVVWAITEGREAARAVDQYLMGESSLPAREKGIFDLA